MINPEEVLKALANARVNFVVIGGFAAVAQGSGLITRDLDICYERTPENLRNLVVALSPFHPRLRGAPKDLPFIFDNETLSKGMNFTLETDLGDIDLLGELAGVGGYKEVVSDASWMRLFNGSYRIASLDVLIRSKKAAGRPKDLIALPELEALKELPKVLPKK
jgi:hypothetical protein